MFGRLQIVGGLAGLVVALAPAYLISGCGTKEQQQQEGCQDDSECKGDRVCIDHKCVFPSEVEGTDAGHEPVCTTHSSKVCSGSDVYWQNSCGLLEEMAVDCASRQYCNNAQCVNEAPVCTSHSSKVCSNGDVYWRDSCGNLQGRAEDCQNGEKCVDTECECVSHFGTVCYNNDVYWQDSCGQREELKTDCNGIQYCEDGNCITPPRFQILDEGSIRDNGSRITWQRGYVSGKTFTQAGSYCSGLTLSGSSSWTLPSMDDYETLRAGVSGFTEFPSGFADPEIDGFWTSSTCNPGFSGHRQIFFFLYVNVCTPNTRENKVRCIKE